MATRRICEFLDGSGVRYITIIHSPAYTAQQIAESAHVPGDEMAKTVIVWLDNRLVMVVVPATKDVSLQLLRRETGSQHAHLAEEADFANRFLGCQLGTVPPFGNLFGLETYVDRCLARKDHVAFNAGTHTDIIMMRYEDYQRLVQPFPVRIAVEPVDVALPIASI
jgi:Ala-tRNA(Pro) deacylase